MIECGVGGRDRFENKKNKTEIRETLRERKRKGKMGGRKGRERGRERDLEEENFLLTFLDIQPKAN